MPQTNVPNAPKERNLLTKTQEWVSKHKVVTSTFTLGAISTGLYFQGDRTGKAGDTPQDLENTQIQLQQQQIPEITQQTETENQPETDVTPETKEEVNTQPQQDPTPPQQNANPSKKTDEPKPNADNQETETLPQGSSTNTHGLPTTQEKPKTPEQKKPNVTLIDKQEDKKQDQQGKEEGEEEGDDKGQIKIDDTGKKQKDIFKNIKDQFKDQIDVKQGLEMLEDREVGGRPRIDDDDEDNDRGFIEVQEEEEQPPVDNPHQHHREDAPVVNHNPQYQRPNGTIQQQDLQTDAKNTYQQQAADYSNKMENLKESIEFSKQQYAELKKQQDRQKQQAETISDIHSALKDAFGDLEESDESNVIRSARYEDSSSSWEEEDGNDDNDPDESGSVLNHENGSPVQTMQKARGRVQSLIRTLRSNENYDADQLKRIGDNFQKAIDQLENNKGPEAIAAIRETISAINEWNLRGLGRWVMRQDDGYKLKKEERDQFARLINKYFKNALLEDPRAKQAMERLQKKIDTDQKEMDNLEEKMLTMQHRQQNQLKDIEAIQPAIDQHRNLCKLDEIKCAPTANDFQSRETYKRIPVKHFIGIYPNLTLKKELVNGFLKDSKLWIQYPENMAPELVLMSILQTEVRTLLQDDPKAKDRERAISVTNMETIHRLISKKHKQIFGSNNNQNGGDQNHKMERFKKWLSFMLIHCDTEELSKNDESFILNDGNLLIGTRETEGDIPLGTAMNKMMGNSKDPHEKTLCTNPQFISECNKYSLNQDTLNTIVGMPEQYKAQYLQALIVSSINQLCSNEQEVMDWLRYYSKRCNKVVLEPCNFKTYNQLKASNIINRPLSKPEQATLYRPTLLPMFQQSNVYAMLPNNETTDPNDVNTGKVFLGRDWTAFLYYSFCKNKDDSFFGKEPNIYVPTAQNAEKVLKKEYGEEWSTINIDTIPRTITQKAICPDEALLQKIRERSSLKAINEQFNVSLELNDQEIQDIEQNLPQYPQYFTNRIRFYKKLSTINASKQHKAELEEELQQVIDRFIERVHATPCMEGSIASASIKNPLIARAFLMHSNSAISKCYWADLPTFLKWVFICQGQQGQNTLKEPLRYIFKRLNIDPKQMSINGHDLDAAEGAELECVFQWLVSNAQDSLADAAVAERFSKFVMGTPTMDWDDNTHPYWKKLAEASNGPQQIAIIKEMVIESQWPIGDLSDRDKLTQRKCITKIITFCDSSNIVLFPNTQLFLGAMYHRFLPERIKRIFKNLIQPGGNHPDIDLQTIKDANGNLTEAIKVCDAYDKNEQENLNTLEEQHNEGELLMELTKLRKDVMNWENADCYRNLINATTGFNRELAIENMIVRTPEHYYREKDASKYKLRQYLVDKILPVVKQHPLNEQEQTETLRAIAKLYATFAAPEIDRDERIIYDCIVAESQREDADNIIKLMEYCNQYHNDNPDASRLIKQAIENKEYKNPQNQQLRINENNDEINIINVEENERNQRGRIVEQPNNNDNNHANDDENHVGQLNVIEVENENENEIQQHGNIIEENNNGNGIQEQNPRQIIEENNNEHNNEGENGQINIRVEEDEDEDEDEDENEIQADDRLDVDLNWGNQVQQNGRGNNNGRIIQMF